MTSVPLRRRIGRAFCANTCLARIYSRSLGHVGPQAQAQFLGRKGRDFHSSHFRCARLPILLADIGEGVTEVEIIRWLIKPGQFVDEFDPICEVQSDKASVEITTRYTGTVEELMVGEGDIAKVGKPLCFIEVKDEEGSQAKEPSHEKGAEIQATRSKPGMEERPEVQDVPADSFDMDGQDRAAQDETLFVDGPTTMSPVKRRGPRSSLQVSSEGPRAHPLSEGAVPSTLAALLSSRTGQPANEPPGILATPATRKLARDRGIDLQTSAIKGSGPEGRITKEDLEERTTGRDEAQRSEGLTGIQKQMFKTMTQALAAPHFVYSDEIDMTQLATLRTTLNKEAQEKSCGEMVKMSFMPFMIKALALSLSESSLLQSRLNVEQGMPRLTRMPHINIGVAMDTPMGLLVPVVPKVDLLTIEEIHRLLFELQMRGKNNKLSPVDLGLSSDLGSATITLSNIGTIGGTYLSPVIPPSTLAIGAVGKIRKLPRYSEEQNGSGPPTVVPRMIMCASFSADHRVVDGMTLARMVDRWKTYLEDPARMTVHLR